MKKVLALVLALCMVFALCACGSVKYSSTTTTTTTTTDANGNTTTTSTTTTSKTYPAGSCGEAAQDGEEHELTISVENALGEDMNGFYICPTGATEWSNLFEEDEYLPNGNTASDYVSVTYSKDAMSFDLGFKGENNELIECDAIDISSLSAQGITITFTPEGWSAK